MKKISVLFVAFAFFAFAGSVLAQLPVLIEYRNLTLPVPAVVFSTDTLAQGMKSWKFNMTAPDTATLNPYGRWLKSGYSATAIPSNGLVAKIRVPTSVGAQVGISISYMSGSNPTPILNSPVVWIGTSDNFADYKFDLLTASGTFDGLRFTLNYKTGQPRGSRTAFVDNIRIINGADTTLFESCDGAIPVPSAPTLLSPANGATGVVRNPTLRISGDQTATSHKFWIVRVSTGDTVFNQTDVTHDSVQVPTNLAENTMFQWGARSQNASGLGSASAVWTFTTAIVVLPPAIPTLATPANGTVNSLLSQVLTWNTVASADSYTVRVTDPNGVLVDSQIVATTSYNPRSVTYARTYFWEVQAKGAGGKSGWSTRWGFTTADAPVVVISAPVLLSPANGATGLVADTVLAVWGSRLGAISYSLQVLDSAGVQVRSYSGADTTYKITGLANGTLYQWRVNASNSSGASVWSETRNFRTRTIVVFPPSPPILVFPADSATNVPRTVQFRWTRGLGVTSEIQVFTAQGTVVSQSGITDSVYSVANMAYNTVHFWRVHVTSVNGTSDWSVTRSFRTVQAVSNPPSLPVLLLPLDGATGISKSVRLVWKKDTLVTSYKVRLRNISGTSVVNQTVSDTTIQVTGLLDSTTYYWEVKAFSASDSSGWTIERSFITASPTSGQFGPPALISPADSAAGIQTDIVLSWEAVTASSYRVQVFRKSDGVIVVDHSVNITSFRVSGLLNATSYIWRVQAIRADSVASDWSATRSFTTAAITLGVPRLLLASGSVTTVTPTISWDSVATATGYDIQIARSSGFSDTVFTRYGITGTQVTVSGLSQNVTYYCHVRARSGVAISSWSPVVDFLTILTVGIDDENGTTPTKFALGQNYPNPFNPSTTIEFTIPKSVTVQIIVYNILGQKVRTLINESMNAGSHSVVFDGRNDFGQQLSSGVYIYRIQAGSFMETKKMAFMK